VGADEFRARARATWAAGDWDSYAYMIAPVGAKALRQAGVEARMTLLDVGTGNGANVAIPAAQAGAIVTGMDVAPELLEHARRHAAEAGVEVFWVEGDAMALPFPPDSFDRVVSTFGGTLFVPDHRHGVAELLRVCRPTGRIAMTTWAAEGFVGELFKLGASFTPPPPQGVDVPLSWGSEDHVHLVFTSAGASAEVQRDTVTFAFPSVDDMVKSYTEDFGSFVMARATLEPEGRWDDYVDAFRDLVVRFNTADDHSAKIESEYLLILVEA
jgi:SAM-dependent methyltransferase